MLKINIIIPSKNRACQLDLMLRTFYKYFKLDYDLTVIYTTSTVEHEEGYRILKDIYPTINFIKETFLKENIIDCIENNLNPFVAFLSDDIIFIRPIEESIFTKRFEENTDIFCLVFRNGATRLKNFNTDEDLIEIPEINSWGEYNWKEATSHFWNTSQLLVGHITRRLELLEIIKNCNFSTPNELEERFVNYPIKKNINICIEHCLIELCINTVQAHPDISYYFHSIPAYFLNEYWVDGLYMDLDETQYCGDYSRIKEIDFKWRQRG